MTFSFNPCPWNVKEHTLLYIMANITSMPPYITHIFVVEEKYFGIRHGVWYETLMVLSCDMIGLVMAGFCRGLTVKSASMLWPQNLVTYTLMNTLHAEQERETGGTNRLGVFSHIFPGSFVFYFFPGMRIYLKGMSRLILRLCRFHIYCSVDVLLDMLDMARERDDQPIVRGIQWTGDGPSDLRLGTNLMGRESANDPLVDAGEHLYEFRRDPVDYGPDRLLYQRQRFRTPSLTCTSLTPRLDVELRTFPD